MYQVKTQKFTGPLEKLVELIEERKLEITQISLAEVTGDFLNYLKSIEQDIDPRLLADFVVVAAKLILIKSKALLPNLELTKEEEGEIHDLELRLKIYNEFKNASQHIKDLLKKNTRAFSRDYLMSMGDQALFYPPEGLKISDLGTAIANLAQALRELIPEPKKVKSAIISVEQKVKELLERFQTAAEHSFKQLAKEKTRHEAIALFLAILHLLKDRVIAVEQPEQFSDIMFKKIEQ